MTCCPECSTELLVTSTGVECPRCRYVQPPAEEPSAGRVKLWRKCWVCGQAKEWGAAGNSHRCPSKAARRPSIEESIRAIARDLGVPLEDVLKQAMEMLGGRA